MQIGMRQFSSATVTQVIEMAKEPSVTRGDLARLLCILDNWHDSRGRLAISSARKALSALSEKANFTLPEAQGGVPQSSGKALPPEGLEKLSGIRLRMSDLGEISIRIAYNREQRRSWDAMMV